MFSFFSLVKESYHICPDYIAANKKHLDFKNADVYISVRDPQ